MKWGVYPGSFNPPTRGHLAIMAAVIDQHELGRLDVVLSQVALAKETVERPTLLDRVGVLQRSVSHIPEISVVVTDRQLLVDIARGYHVLVMGADKWVQIQDPVFYNNSPTERDAAMAALPTLAIAPREGLDIPVGSMLELPGWVAEVSSTEARAGNIDAMTPAAQRFDADTGAWTDPDRYDQHQADM